MRSVKNCVGRGEKIYFKKIKKNWRTHELNSRGPHNCPRLAAVKKEREENKAERVNNILEARKFILNIKTSALHYKNIKVKTYKNFLTEEIWVETELLG